MQDNVTQLIKGCIVCCTNKPSNRKQGLYHPLLVPTRLWESTSMDFMGAFPRTRWGHGYLFMVVDRFSKVLVLVVCYQYVPKNTYLMVVFIK
jgi:hypothetical protein